MISSREVLIASARDVASVPEGSRVPRTMLSVDVGDGYPVVFSTGGEAVSCGGAVVPSSVGGTVASSAGGVVVVVSTLELLAVMLMIVTVEELAEMPEMIVESVEEPLEVAED